LDSFMTLEIGDPAPDFTLPDQAGHPVQLSALKGQRVVIYFYPKDDTPGCTKEACGFRDLWGQFEAHGIKVLGISKDGAASHGKFISKYELPFTLLTDAEPCPVAAAYESYGLKKFMGKEYMGMMRHSFVVAPDGTLEKIYRKVKAEEMAEQVLIDLGLNGPAG
jgi:peroxiredoxin Q/BCP